MGPIRVAIAVLVLGITSTTVTSHSTAPPPTAYQSDAELSRAFDMIRENLLMARRPCHVRYNNKCYWGIFRAPSTTNYANAKLSCEEEGGTLADIHTIDHFNRLAKYARRWTVVKDTLGLWTKMTVNSINGDLRLSDGTVAPKGMWWNTYPVAGLYHGDKGLVYLTVSPSSQGLINGNGNSVLFGALCEKSLGDQGVYKILE